MTCLLPPLRRFLDPRDACEALEEPIRDSVNIPFDELTKRLHELPGRGEPIYVVGPRELGEKTVEWLSRGGRSASWHEKWQIGDAPEPGRLWQPTAFLQEILEQLEPGTAIDLGCGTGRDAVAMAAYGWKVVAVDHLQSALERARELERRYAPQGAEAIRWESWDLEDKAFKIEERFDLVCSFRFLHRPLIASAANWLTPGGQLVVETFTRLHFEKYGKPKPPHILELGELADLPKDLTLCHFSEDWRVGHVHTARLWAVK